MVGDRVVNGVRDVCHIGLRQSRNADARALEEEHVVRHSHVRHLRLAQAQVGEHACPGGQCMYAKGKGRFIENHNGMR